MSFQIRTNLSLYYRLFFITLFLLLGVSGVGVVVLEYYAGIDLIVTESDFDDVALYTTSIVLGVLGFIVALTMILLMQERRGLKSDRRQLTESLGFSDRRSNIDRRSA